MHVKDDHPDESAGLKITIHEGVRTGKASLLCELEGGVILENGAPLTVWGEAIRVLELCADKYSTPCPTQEDLTVFAWRKDRGNLAPLFNVDIELLRGTAKSVSRDFSGHTFECETVFEADDDVVSIIRKVLSAMLRGEG
ncbi:hypothetical protein AB4Y35_18335 [Paraburkholderia sp. EG286A]|uniref:hypothetical protein n=1 Tax=Paraburkholderia sp. EG286A TaxID=3237014 RepID=UPI0034D25FC0